MPTSSKAFLFRITFFFFFFSPLLSWPIASVLLFTGSYIPTLLNTYSACSLGMLDSVPTPGGRAVDGVLALREFDVMSSCILWSQEADNDRRQKRKWNQHSISVEGFK